MMSDKTKEIQEETPETEEPSLEDLTTADLKEEPSTPEELTVTIGDEDVKVSELADWYANDKKWKAKNTQEAQKIAEERKRLETERVRLEKIMSESKESEPEESEDLFGEIDDYDDPTVKALLSHTRQQDATVKKLLAEMDAIKKQREQDQFAFQSQSEHSRLKSMYQDYDPEAIENETLNTQSWYEKVYQAKKLNDLLNNPEAMLKSLPEDFLKKYRKEIEDDFKAQLVTRLKKKEEAAKKASSTPTVTGTGGIKETVEQPTTYRDARKSALDELREAGLSLTK